MEKVLVISANTLSVKFLGHFL